MLYLIACVAKNMGIGYKGELLFHYPEDMAFFKEKTMGNVVVMGRKTYESLKRPLTGRKNVIMTRNLDYVAPSCTVIHSLEEYYKMAAEVPKDKDIYIIGGEALYKLFLPLADGLYLTEVNDIVPADAFFPWFNKENYDSHTKSTGCGYKIVKYTDPIAKRKMKQS